LHSKNRTVIAKVLLLVAFWKMRTTLSATVYDYFGVITRLTVDYFAANFGSLLWNVDVINNVVLH